MRLLHLLNEIKAKYLLLRSQTLLKKLLSFMHKDEIREKVPPSNIIFHELFTTLVNSSIV